MGGEMVNILHQRLDAQKVDNEKGNLVLQDVIRTMYSAKVKLSVKYRQYHVEG